MGTPGAVVSPGDAASNWHPVAVRLADEGIPVAAIARSVGAPSADVRTVLHQAIIKSEILQMPREDWPLHTSRSERTTGANPRVSLSDPTIVLQLMRAYSITGSEAQLLSVLMRRPEVLTEALHQSLQKPDREETEIKIIAVLICKLRQKLKQHHIYIRTIWGKGYFLDPDGRKLIFEKLGIPASEGPEAGAVAEVIASAAPSGGMVRQSSKAA
jgi:DNA-binding winged helix-turn-helix (wHTH) protein